MTSKKSVKLTTSQPAPVKMPASTSYPVVLSDPLPLYDGPALHRVTVVFRSEKLGSGLNGNETIPGSTAMPAGPAMSGAPGIPAMPAGPATPGTKGSGLPALPLGTVLLQAFISALEAQAQPPETLIFYHHAVCLLTRGSPILEGLHRLQQKGTEILACSISLQYLGLTDQLAVGEISTMAIITDHMLRARHILWP